MIKKMIRKMKQILLSIAFDMKLCTTDGRRIRILSPYEKLSPLGNFIHDINVKRMNKRMFKHFNKNLVIARKRTY